MKSDSLIKITACILSFSLILSTCVKPVNADTGSVVKSDESEAGFDICVAYGDYSNIEEAVYTDISGMASYSAPVIENTDISGTDISNEGQTVEGQNQEMPASELPVETVDSEVTNEVVEPVSEYANTGISVADPYVNVRSEANTDSEVVGKLYKGSAATILEQCGDWVKISSGNVEGYIKTEFLAIGFNAEELVNTYATKYATVMTTTLNVREMQDSTSRLLTQIPEGETYVVSEETDEWVKISIDDGDISGYISKEYVNIRIEFKQAISIEEEQAAAEKEAERIRRAEEEETRRIASQKAKAYASAATSKSNNTQTTQESASSSSEGASDVVSCALQYVGNRYVYGGSSLTNGTDCSGFTQAIYRKFGYSLARSSRDQYSSAGSVVSMDSLQPGDLLFYTSSSGTVNHVAIYIGNGNIVHASNSRDGIKISKYNYRTPCRARRVMN